MSIPLTDTMESKILEFFGGSKFLLLGMGPVDLSHEQAHLSGWLQSGYHGSMTYMETHAPLRCAPDKLMSGTRSILSFGLNYHPGRRVKHRSSRVAKYAHTKDYHRLFWREGAKLLETLRDHWPQIEGRVLCDSAPLLERAVAEQLSGGFTGKNSCYIHPRWGSFLVLGEILLNLEITARGQGTPKKPTCGTCSRCRVHCPTQAIIADKVVDARRCLSFQTIENRGTIPKEFWPHLAKYWYGCDICQDVCPFNRGKPEGTSFPRAVPENLDLYQVATMDQGFYENVFGGTAMTRAKRVGLIRNALIAMWACGDSRLVKALDHHAQASEPVIQKTRADLLAETSGQGSVSLKR